MFLVMASMVSLHSDFFLARIDVIFPFVVLSCKRPRKVNNESLFDEKWPTQSIGRSDAQTAV